MYLFNLSMVWLRCMMNVLDIRWCAGHVEKNAQFRRLLNVFESMDIAQLHTRVGSVASKSVWMNKSLRQTNRTEWWGETDWETSRLTRASQSYAVLGLSLGRSRWILANERQKWTGFLGKKQMGLVRELLFTLAVYCMDVFKQHIGNIYNSKFVPAFIPHFSQPTSSCCED